MAARTRWISVASARSVDLRVDVSLTPHVGEATRGDDAGAPARLVPPAGGDSGPAPNQERQQRVGSINSARRCGK